jgi:hypothetical protein
MTISELVYEVLKDLIKKTLELDWTVSDLTKISDGWLYNYERKADSIKWFHFAFFRIMGTAMILN